MQLQVPVIFQIRSLSRPACRGPACRGFFRSRIFVATIVFAIALLLDSPPVFAGDEGSINSDKTRAQANLDKVTQNNSNHHYMGVATCASSNCHGGAAPRNAANVLQNEYVTWQKHDRHAMAYTVLEGEDSKRIASHLQIAAPEKDPLCLSCHATFVKKDLQGEKFRVEDGVSCESCHGAAENWLKEHTESGATHERNLSLGMADIVSPHNRTALCASCHLGTDEKTVNHRLIGAGHPRLSFELDTFGMIQPKHWMVDDDYKKRKEDYSSARTWLVGQVTLASESLEKLLSSKRSKDGVMPELTLMYCYSCHHSLTELQWKKREYAGVPGQLRLNVAHLIIVREALKTLNPALGTELESKVTALHQSYGNQDVGASAKELLGLMRSKVQSASEKANLDEKSLAALTRSLLQYAASSPQLQYEVAEQVAMAISSVLASRDPEGRLYKVPLESLYKTLKTPESFVAEDFTESAGAFLKAL